MPSAVPSSTWSLRRERQARASRPCARTTRCRPRLRRPATRAAGTFGTTRSALLELGLDLAQLGFERLDLLRDRLERVAARAELVALLVELRHRLVGFVLLRAQRLAPLITCVALRAASDAIASRLRAAAALRRASAARTSSRWSTTSRRSSMRGMYTDSGRRANLARIQRRAIWCTRVRHADRKAAARPRCASASWR